MGPLRVSFFAPCVGAFLVVSAALAGPLQKAEIHKIVNDVRVVDTVRGSSHVAALRDVVADDVAVRTGVQSRAELLFQDNTLTRLGAETYFSFKPGTRDMTLDRGTMLLQVPKGLGGARIRAAAVTAAITGTTIMIENLPRKSVKVIVLEGSLRLSINGRFGESVVLKPGKMVIVGANDVRMPQPVTVDLSKLVKTSALVEPNKFNGGTNAKADELPSMPLIKKEISIQTAAKDKSELAETNLLIQGNGTKVVMASKETMAALNASPEGTAGKTPNIAAAGDGSGRATGAQGAASTGTSTTANTTAGTASGNSSGTASQGTGGSAPVATNTTFAPPETAGLSSPTGDFTTASTIAGTTSNAGTSGSGATASISSPSSLNNLSGLSSLSNLTSLAAPAINIIQNTTTAIPSTATASTVAPTFPAGPAFILVPNPYLITVKTSFNTSALTVTTSGVTDAGGLYRSASVSGSASKFLFGNTSAFDGASNFDSTFGAKNGGAIPAAGIAVYRFTDLQLSGQPSVQMAGGAKDVALISQNGIGTLNASSDWPLDSMRSLFLGSVNGPITLGGQFSKVNFFAPFSYMQVFARGTGGVVILDGTFNLGMASIYVNGEAGVHLNAGSKVSAFKVGIDSPATVTLDGDVTAASLTIKSGTGVEMNKSPSVGYLSLNAPYLATAANIGTIAGTLTIGSGGLTTGGYALTGFDSITVSGDADVGTIWAKNALMVTGRLTTSSNNGDAALTAGSIVVGGGINLTGKNNGNGGTLTLNATNVIVSSTGIKDLSTNGADATAANGSGGNGGTVNIGSALLPVSGSVTISSPVTATTGKNGSGTPYGGNGGSVNVVANGTVTVGSTVKVSDSASRNAGNISIVSKKTSGTAITISNSGQLLSLLNSASPGKGGVITFSSDGGTISVAGGTVVADRGTVDIRNNGANGMIYLTNANIRGDTVKVGAFGAGGQLLIGGGTISADTALKLYAGSSSGQVRFTDNVTLGGSGTKAIAGMTVTVAPTKVVTIGGAAPATIYTNSPNYSGSGGNGTSSGTFGGQGATTKPFVLRPAF